MVFWILLGFAATGLAFWIVTSSWVPTSPLVQILTVAFFGIAPVGAFWMLYVVIRFEKRPFPLILLAFIPYGFVAYYFERVRPRKHRTHESPA
jgi:hypothetical protein